MEKLCVTKMKTSPTVCLLKFVDKAFKRMLASGNVLLKKYRVLRKRQLRTAHIENHIPMYKSDNIIMFFWFSLILKLTRWNAFFKILPPPPPRHQTNSFRRKFTLLHEILATLILRFYDARISRHLNLAILQNFCDLNHFNFAIFSIILETNRTTSFTITSKFSRSSTRAWAEPHSFVNLLIPDNFIIT